MEFGYLKINKRRMEGEIIFNKITEKLIYTTRRYRNLSDDQFKFARASNMFQMFSRML